MKQTSRQTRTRQTYNDKCLLMSTLRIWGQGREKVLSRIRMSSCAVMWMASLFHLWDPLKSVSLTMRILLHPFQYLKFISIPLTSHYTFSWWLRLSSGFEFGELFFRDNFLRFLWHFKDRFHFKEPFASFRPQRVRTTQTQKTQHALNFRHSTAF